MAEEQPLDGLAELRQKIDALDEQLVRLLNARAACALEIGSVKKTAGLPVYQPSRETEVLRHVQSINPGPLDDARRAAALRTHHRRGAAAGADCGRASRQKRNRSERKTPE